jgi:hypothetical protein
MKRRSCVVLPSAGIALLLCALAALGCANAAPVTQYQDRDDGGASHRPADAALEEDAETPPDAPRAGRADAATPGPDGGLTPDAGSTMTPDAARVADGPSSTPDAALPPDGPRTVNGITRFVISEVMFDPMGGDTNLEQVELYNGTSAAIALTGWKIRAGGTAYATIHNLTGTIAAGQCLLVTGLDGMQNGGTASDAVALVDPTNAIVDAVIYDSPNSNNLVDETGSQDIDVPAAAGDGKTLERTGPTTWINQTTPTLGNCSVIGG